jgi:hypothetical protein
MMVYIRNHRGYLRREEGRSNDGDGEHEGEI